MVVAVPSNAASARRMREKYGGSLNPCFISAVDNWETTPMKSLLLRTLVVLSPAKTDRSASSAAARSTFGGRKSMTFKSSTNPRASRLTNPINPRTIARLVSIGTSTVMPKSRYVKPPFSATNRLPGCGSVCMNPELSN